MKSIIMALPCLLITGIALAQNYHDSWVDPILICDQRPFEWKAFEKVEPFPVEEFDACLKPFESIAQVWIKVKVSNRAELGFEISPKNTQDDIDFIVFRSTNGVPSEAIRCMATGLQMDKTRMTQINCAGVTGLMQGEVDLMEDPGCSSQKSNFLKPISTGPGDEYLILITNYESIDGFILTWNGNAEFDPTYCISQADSGTQLFLSPNPASQWLNWKITTTHPIKSVLRLFSHAGIVLEKIPVNLQPGANEERLSLGAVPSGKYYLLLHQGDQLLGYSSFEIVK